MKIREIIEAGPSGKRNKLRVKETLKMAVWEAHSRKCFYCGEPVGFKDLHPDHIIPQSVDYETLLTLTKNIHLPPSFDLNGPENLLPTHSKCNERKNKFIPSLETLSGPLIVAEQKKKRVLNLLQKFKEQNSVNYNTAKALCYLESEMEGQSLSAEEIYDRLSGGGEPFPKDNTKYDNQIRISESNISLWCYLPKFPDLKGSLAISFRNLKIRDCTISFKHEDIVNILFQAVNSPPRLSLRKFIRPLESDKYLTSLGSVTFTMDSTEADQLCSIIDRLVIQYINANREVESIFQSNRFLPAKSGGFYLFKTSRKAWAEIISFAQKHDAFNANGQWDVFDSHGSFLKIFSSLDTSNNKEYRMFAYPEQVENEYWQVLTKSDDEVWVRWEPNILLLNEDGVSMFRKGEIWDAEYSFEWCINRLFPRIIHNHRSQHFWRNLLKLPCDVSHIWNEPAFWDGESLHTINNINNLLVLSKAIGRMQSFYTVHSDAFMPYEGIKGIYRSVLYCLEAFKLSDGTINYIYQKTGGDASIQGIRQWIQFQLHYPKLELGVSGSETEYALRPVVVVLSHELPKLPEIEIVKILVELLSPAWKSYILENYIDRLRLF